MQKNKTASNLRLIFSAVALLAFVLYSLIDNLAVTEHASYYTYWWRMGLMNDLFLLIPFVALFVFAVLEKKLEYVNARVCLFGLFLLYTVQAGFMFFNNPTSDFSIFTCPILGRSSDVTVTFLLVRFIMLFLILVAGKIILKIYSLGMISFFSMMLIGLLFTNRSYTRYIGRSITQIVIALIIDILFHVALYFFCDLLTKENKATPWLCELAGIDYCASDKPSECDADFTKVKNNLLKDENKMIDLHELFTDDKLDSNGTITVDTDDFLLDPPENAVMYFELERVQEKTVVSGRFTYTFDEELAIRALRKKSVLNKTFRAICLCAEADADIDVESVGDGSFTVRLDKKEFDTSCGFDELRNYMSRFLDVITVIHNTESYE